MEIYTFLDDITLAGFLRREKVSELVRQQQGNVTLAVAELNSTVA
jgi:hypothetical protein